MSDSDTDKSNIVIVAIMGIALGAIIVYALLNRRTQNLSIQQQYQRQPIDIPIDPIDIPNIPRVDDVIGKLQSQNVYAYTRPQQIETQAEQAMSIYKNNEKWEIKRDIDGSIMSINVMRDVKKA